MMLDDDLWYIWDGKDKDVFSFVKQRVLIDALQGALCWGDDVHYSEFSNRWLAKLPREVRPSLTFAPISNEETRKLLDLARNGVAFTAKNGDIVYAFGTTLDSCLNTLDVGE